MGLYHANSHVIHINLSIYRNQAKTEVYCVKILAKTCERTELANHSQYDLKSSINFLLCQIIIIKWIPFKIPMSMFKLSSPFCREENCKASGTRARVWLPLRAASKYRIWWNHTCAYLDTTVHVTCNILCIRGKITRVVWWVKYNTQVDTKMLA